MQRLTLRCVLSKLILFLYRIAGRPYHSYLHSLHISDIPTFHSVPPSLIPPHRLNLRTCVYPYLITFSKITQARIRSCANFSIILNEVIEK